MAALVWDAIGSRFYESGITRGVFYDSDGYGVAWNGLTSIEENTSNQVESIYFDGSKINDVVTTGDFSATMKAFTYPDEFLPYEGIVEDVDGVFITGQSISRFGLSYQTKIGNDLIGTTYGYKLHLLYNLTAIPTQRTFNTLSLETEPVEFEWNITSIPEIIENYRPTAHVIFDSTKIQATLLQSIEDSIYGTAYYDPQLLPLNALLNFIRS
jgi:hypothetical protein